MKQYKQGSSLNQSIVEGVNILADNVAATLGPRGRTVAMFHKEQGIPVISKDGVTIADFVELEDPFQNLGAQIIKQAARQTEQQLPPCWLVRSSTKVKSMSHLACPLWN